MFYEILVFRWLFHTQFTPCPGTIGNTIDLNGSLLLTEYRRYCCHHQRVWADTRKQQCFGYMGGVSVWKACVVAPSRGKASRGISNSVLSPDSRLLVGCDTTVIAEAFWLIDIHCSLKQRDSWNLLVQGGLWVKFDNRNASWYDSIVLKSKACDMST